MNGVPVDYEGAMKMTAGGVWYIDRIRCGDDTIEGWGAKIHLMMNEAEARLKQHNAKKEQPEKKEE